MFSTPPVQTRRQKLLAVQEEAKMLEIKSDGSIEHSDAVKDKVKCDESAPAAMAVASVAAPKSEGGSRSHSSSSSSARMKQLEYEATQARAKIEMMEAEAEATARLVKTKARLEKELLEKKLAADLACLQEEESSRCSQRSSPLTFTNKVENWLDKSVAAPGSSLQRGLEESTGNDDMRYHRNTVGGTGTGSVGAIEALTVALRDAVGISSTQTKNQELLTRLSTSKDLPIFYGDPMEWLQFKEAYHESSRLCNYSDTENLWRLRKCLRGEAKEATSSLLISATSPIEVLETLELRFGRPENIMRKITYQIRKLHPLPPTYHSEIVNFAIKIRNFVAAIRAIKQNDFLRSPEQVAIIMSKLPAALISKWADYMYENPNENTPKLELLSTFLYEEATKIATSGVSYIQNQADFRKKTDGNRSQSHNHTVLVCTDNDNKTNCKFCKKQIHLLAECTKFKKALRRDRWRFVRANKLCFKCLGARHDDSATCPADCCDVDGCGFAHHRLLHWAPPATAGGGGTARPPHGAQAPSRDEDAQPCCPPDSVLCSEICEKVCLNAINNSKVSKIMLKIVPVTIYGPTGSVHAHALLDDGATVSLIAAGIADKVGLHGESITMRARSAWDSGELVHSKQDVNGGVMEECHNCSYLTFDNDSFVFNSTHNVTIDKFFFYQSAQLAILWVMLVAIVAGNATVVLALLLTKPRKSRMNFFIMQLAIADLLVGFLSVLPDLIQRITITWYAGSILCKLSKYLQGVVTYSSTYVLVALSVDRCDAITHPMHFTGSWRRARALIVAAWFISFIFCIPMLILFDEQDVEGTIQCWARLSTFQWQVWVTSVFILLFVAPAFTISACYGVIVLTIRNKSHRVLGRRATVSRQYSDDMDGRRASSRGIIPKAKIKTVKMTFVIVFVFVLCWCPYMIFDLLQVYQYIPETQSSMAIASLIQSLAPLNSAANPVIYFIFSNRIFVSLRNIPPYKWFWCWMKPRDSPGAESRAHTELLTSSHRRTRHDLTFRMKDDSIRQPKQHILHNSTNSRKVRLHLPETQLNNNCHMPRRRDDTFL